MDAARWPLVLVVEDEALLAIDFEATLRAHGYDVAWAPDGPRALAALAAAPGRFAAAVVNIGLPGAMRGQQVVRALRGMRRRLPVVVATGYAPGSPQADLRGLGGPTERVAKPVDHAEFLARLQDAMRRGPGYYGPERRGRRGGGWGAAPPGP